MGRDASTHQRRACVRACVRARVSERVVSERRGGVFCTHTTDCGSGTVMYIVHAHAHRAHLWSGRWVTHQSSNE
jgi:hypothetical protein